MSFSRLFAARIRVVSIATLFMASMVCAIPAWSAEVVTFTANTPLLAKPKASADKILVVEQGAKAKLRAIDGDYALVQLKPILGGWVLKKYLKRNEASANGGTNSTDAFDDVPATKSVGGMNSSGGASSAGFMSTQ